MTHHDRLAVGSAHGRSCGRHVTDRRRFMGGLAGVLVATTAGCLGEDEAVAEPVDLTEGQTCDVCGMVIAEHYGPAVQAFYDGDAPGTAGRPARFDTVHEFVAYHYELTLQRAELVAAFATDYAIVDYAIDRVDGVPYISTHATRGDFHDVRELSFVVASEVHGAMGTDAIPFSDEAAADAFIDEFDGRRHPWADIRTGFER